MDAPIPQDDMVILEAEDCDAWQLPDAILLIGRCDTFVSQGFFDVAPGKTLSLEEMPAPLTLKQMAGQSLIIIAEEKSLKAGETMQIPTSTPLAVKNPSSEKAVIAWKYSGDVTAKLTALREKYPEVPANAREKSGYKELFEEYQKRAEEKQGDY